MMAYVYLRKLSRRIFEMQVSKKLPMYIQCLVMVCTSFQKVLVTVYFYRNILKISFFNFE